MRIFNKTEQWGGEKVNFVDDNNVLLGYDMGQGCCENTDWFIADTQIERTESRKDEIADYPGWNFDTSFFRSIDRAGYGEGDSLFGGDYNALDSGEMVIFRLVNGDQEKFLHLYNCHNGYYGHGFTFSIGDQGIREGTL